MRKYKEKQLIDEVTSYINNEDINLLYKQGFINIKGDTFDSKISYSEIIAKTLIQSNIIKENEIIGISKIYRDYDYPKRGDDWVLSHVKNTSKLRREEHLVFEMQSSQKEKLYSFGKMIDYQVPIKGNNKDIAGKIDFIAINEKEVNLCEIKNDVSEETLLRAVLEISTYYQQIDTDNLRKTLLKNNDAEHLPINKVVVIFKNTNPYYNWININNTPYLKQIIKLLNVNVLVVSNNHQAIIEEI